MRPQASQVSASGFSLRTARPRRAAPTIAGSWNCGGNCYLSLYGWTTNPLMLWAVVGGGHIDGIAVALAIACDVHPLQNMRVLNYLKSEFDQDQSGLDRWCHAAQCRPLAIVAAAGE